MFDDVITKIQTIINSKSGRRGRRGIAFQTIIADIFLLGAYFGTTTEITGERTVTHKLLPLGRQNNTTIWAFVSLIPLANMLLQRSILTPEIKTQSVIIVETL